MTNVEKFARCVENAYHCAYIHIYAHLNTLAMTAKKLPTGKGKGTVVINLTISKEQFGNLEKKRKEANLFHVQELIRIFISNGLKQL